MFFVGEQRAVRGAANLETLGAEMNYVLSALFLFNLAASALMIRWVFPHLTVMVEKGQLSSTMKTAALAMLTFEGGVSGLSFLSLYDDGGSAMILLGLYAGATASIYIWVAHFHRGRWGRNH
jgi:hypothetical protein